MPVGLMTPVATFLWNLTQNVGIGSPNVPEDVQFVQLAYWIMGNDRSLGLSDEERVVFGAVNPRGSYNATELDPLTKAIRLHQRKRGGTQDGHVSAFRGGGSYTVGSQTFTMMLGSLNLFVAQHLKDKWPHLDRHEMCPPQLADRARATFQLV